MGIIQLVSRLGKNVTAQLNPNQHKTRLQTDGNASPSSNGLILSGAMYPGTSTLSWGPPKSNPKYTKYRYPPTQRNTNTHIEPCTAVNGSSQALDAASRPHPTPFVSISRISSYLSGVQIMIP
jgi:hypothetical protein